MQHNRLTQSIRLALFGGVAASALALAACGGGSGSSDGGSGTLSLGVTDAPVDSAEHVYVEFDSVTLVPGDGDDEMGEDLDDDIDGDDGADAGLITIELSENRRIDLLAQQNGKRALLIEDEAIPAGDYEQVRLGIVPAGTEIIIDGQTYTLRVPSGLQSGLKINTGGLELTDGGALDLTIDFNLRHSIVQRGNPGNNNGYLLKPVLRLVETDDTGAIEVVATDTYVSANQCGTDESKQAAYVFAGDITPDDVDGIEPDPISSVQLDTQNGDGQYTGTAGYLEPGTYTVAYTCNPEDDAPPTDDQANDDAITFLDPAVVDVEAGEPATYALPPQAD